MFFGGAAAEEEGGGAGTGVTVIVGGGAFDDGELGLGGNTVTVMGSVFSGLVGLGVLEEFVKVRFPVTLLEGSDAVTVTTGREKEVELAGTDEVLKAIVLLICQKFQAEKAIRSWQGKNSPKVGKERGTWFLAGSRRCCVVLLRTTHSGTNHVVDALARRRAKTLWSTVCFAIIALLMELGVRHVVSATHGSCSTRNDVRNAHGAVSKLLLARTRSIHSHGQRVEATGSFARIVGENLVDAAVPVARNVIVQRGHDIGRGHEMGVVQTRVAEITADLEVSDLGQRLDGHLAGVALVVARKREVHARTVLVAERDVADGVLHHGVGARQPEPFGMEGRVGADEDHVPRHGRGPDFFGVVQELDGVETAVAEAVGHDDGLVLGKVGRGHAVPFRFIFADVGCFILVLSALAWFPFSACGFYFSFSFFF